MASPTETTPTASAHIFERPFADLTLRAVADGATARVHRGIVAFHSRVFSNALTTPDSPPDELPLPGKDASDLRMLVAYMYPRRSRTETFTAKGAQPSIVRFCELSREWDMPELLAAAGEWLDAHAQQLVLPQIAVAGSNKQAKASRFLTLLQCAHDFGFSHFFELGMTSWTKCLWKSDVLKLCAEEARRLDGEILFRMLAGYEKAPAALVFKIPPTKSSSSDDSSDDSSSSESDSSTSAEAVLAAAPPRSAR
jgi:hypothetical protein